MTPAQNCSQKNPHSKEKWDSDIITINPCHQKRPYLITRSGEVAFSVTVRSCRFFHAWNAKCPIFWGNFTLKPATIALKIGHQRLSRMFFFWRSWMRSLVLPLVPMMLLANGSGHSTCQARVDGRWGKGDKLKVVISLKTHRFRVLPVKNPEKSGGKRFETIYKGFLKWWVSPTTMGFP